MKSKLLLAALLLKLSSIDLTAQPRYPFEAPGEDILAYWYVIPKDSIEIVPGKRFDSFSQVHVYAELPRDRFELAATALAEGGEKILDRSFVYQKGEEPEDFSVEIHGGFFRLVFPVADSERKPARILVTIKSGEGERSEEIACRYRKLHGKVTDFRGQAVRGYVLLGPDSFPEAGLGVACDSEGRYEIDLPERTYNSILANYKTDGDSTREPWAWHISMDTDQQLDFKIGNGEIYGLNVWPSNGGFPIYFISFRPMVLFPEGVEREGSYPLDISGSPFQVTDIAPELDIDDLSVSVNGKTARILSVQSYFETSDKAEAMPAYLIQVSREGIETNGKQTFLVEFEKEVLVGDKKLHLNSMGYFQLKLNFSGLSAYNE